MSDLKKEHFKLRKHTRYLTIHRLTEEKSWEELAYEEKCKNEKRKIAKIWRRRFLDYHLQKHRDIVRIDRLRARNSDENVFVAKKWYFVLEKYPLQQRVRWSFQRVHKLSKRNERIAQEIEEILDCDERYSLIESFSDSFERKNLQEIRKINRIERFSGRVESLRHTLIRSHSIMAMNIRVYFEKKNGLIFDVNKIEELNQNGMISIKSLRETLLNNISWFGKEIRENLLNKNWRDERKKSMVENFVIQETTHAAFTTIRNYLNEVRNKSPFIVVDCMIIDRKLSVNMEQLRFFLKDPVNRVCSMEYARVSSEEVEMWMEECVARVEILAHENILAHPLIQPYAFLIDDYKVATKIEEDKLIRMFDESTNLQIRLGKMKKMIFIGCFVIRIESVWKELERRIRSYRNSLKMAIRRKLTSILNRLLHDFRNYDRTLQYRSIDPALMLKNKSLVDEMLQNEIFESARKFVEVYENIFEISQHISLDTTQLDTLLNIASIRLSIPQSINDHAHFFNKRISNFLHFVMKKQSRVTGNVQKAMEKLRIVQTMGNPQEVEHYVVQMKKLRPMLDSLITEIEDLNRFEKAVNIQVSDITKMRQFVGEIQALENLFETTSEYYKHVNSFFESRRTLVNIEATRVFINNFTVQLSLFESSLTTHRAAKHFIAYARNEIDTFKKNFSVAEVMSCRRLLDIHWIRMSEIVGFDLSPYANSSIAQICELGLEAHLQQLKPIAFSAEREANAADQLHEIVTFWSTEHLEMRNYSQWKLSLALRIKELLQKAKKDNKVLKYMTGVEQIIDDSLPYWIEWTTQATVILKEWGETQEHWMRVAKIFVTCKSILRKEYELLRTCAKYWIKIERNTMKDSTIHRIIQLPHLQCWIGKIRKNVNFIIEGIRDLLDKMRITNARLCLSSELHLLSLFSTTSVDSRLKMLLRDCFPSLRRLCFNRRNQLEMTDMIGERITLDLNRSETEKLDPCELIKAIECAFAVKLTEIITIERQDRQKASSRIGASVGELMETRNSLDPLFMSRVDKQYFLQHKSIQKQSPLTVDFVHSDENSKFIGKSLADNWCNGKIILLRGEMGATRNFTMKLANCLCSNVRIINSHDNIGVQLFERLSKIISIPSWFVLLENVDLLAPEVMFNMFNLLANHNSPFPRLFLSCTEEMKCTIPSSISVEVLKREGVGNEHHLQHIEESKSTSSYLFDMSAASPSNSVHSSASPSNRPPQITAPPSSPHALLLDTISTKIRRHEIAGCAGSMAKLTLKETLGQFAEKVTWLYVDVFSRNQLLSPNRTFAAAPSGILFDLLSPEPPSPIGDDSERSYHSSVSTNSVSIQNIIVFYGFSQFWNIFSFITPLFRKREQLMQQVPFLTLDDGSTFWPNENNLFLMCIPDDEGLHLSTVDKFDIPYHTISSSSKLEVLRCYKKTWHRKFSELFRKITLNEIMDELVEQLISPICNLFKSTFFWPSMLFEVIYQDLTDSLPLSRTTSVNDTLRITVIFATLNFISINCEFHAQKHLAIVKSKCTIQLPENLCSWKVSDQDAMKLVRWEEEPFCQSSIEKESAICDVMIVTPNIDRLLFYCIRLLTNGHNILVHGKPYSRKTMLVKMIAKYLSSNVDGIEFVWLDGKSRVGNEVAQRKFTQIIEMCEKVNKQLKDHTWQLLQYVVIDRFSFTEPLLPIIEFFVDHKTFWKNGELCKSDVQLRMIIITDEMDYTWLHNTKALSSTFLGIAMPSTTVTIDQKALVQSLISANFTAKSFSSEYHHTLESFSDCIVSLVRKPYLAKFSSMAMATRLAKAFFYAFPDNCPDLDALIRLFIHESVRVIGDAIDPKQRPLFARELEQMIEESFHITIQKILKSMMCIGEEEEDDVVDEENVGLTNIFDMIYSEVDAHDVVDGLCYEPVIDRRQFQRSIENFLFEHHRNHEKDRIRLFIDWQTACWVQRVIRVIRQASEHMVLVGPPSSGRTQIVKAACVACNSTMMHLQIDTSSYETFISRWEHSFSRAINIIANSNQHVVILCHFDFSYEKVEPRWMELLKLWIESPNTHHFVTDEQLHLLGEQLIECEKNLATQMQTVGLRLPGQRMCKYLPVETLKDPKMLRQVLDARIFDALHVIFLVDPQFKYDFTWCTVFHLPTIEKTLYLEKVKKIISDCKIEAAELIISTFELVNNYLQSIGKNSSQPSFSQLFEVADCFQIAYNQHNRELVNEGNQLKDALHTCEKIELLEEMGRNIDVESVEQRMVVNEQVLSKMNQEKNIKEGKIENLMEEIDRAKKRLEIMKCEEMKLQNELDSMILVPQEEARKCVEHVLKFTSSDLKTLAKMNKPSIGIKLCCEMLRTLFEPQFKPKRNTTETWAESQKFLHHKSFFVKIATCDAECLGVEQMKALKRYVERVEFNANRIEHESMLAAHLCRWISAFLELACAIRVMQEQLNECRELKRRIRKMEVKLEGEMREMEELKRDVEKLITQIREIEQTVGNDRRLMDYRMRSGGLLKAFEMHRNRWKRELAMNEKRQEEVVGNTLVFAIYRALLLCHDRSVSQTAIGFCSKYLHEKNIKFDSTIANPSNVIMYIMRNLKSWRRFCLFVDPNSDDILKNLRTLQPNSTFINMSTVNWTDRAFCENLPRCVYSIVPTVFYNIKECPPPEMYEVLMKSEEKEICYKNRPIELPEDLLFVFIAKELSLIPDQISKLMEVILVCSPIENIIENGKSSRNQLASLLCEFTAADILESKDLSNKVMKFAQGNSLK